MDNSYEETPSRLIPINDLDLTNDSAPDLDLKHTSSNGSSNMPALQRKSDLDLKHASDLQEMSYLQNTSDVPLDCDLQQKYDLQYSSDVDLKQKSAEAVAQNGANGVSGHRQDKTSETTSKDDRYHSTAIGYSGHTAQDTLLPAKSFPDKKCRAMTYEDLLTSLGEFGRYQKLVCLLLCMTHINLGIQLIGSVFTLAAPPHRCAVPGLANDSWRSSPPGLDPFHHNGSGSPPDLDTHSSCVAAVPAHRHGNWSSWNGGGDVANQYQRGVDNSSGVDSAVVCDRYVYDTSIYTATIATKLDLVCERNLYRSHAQMVMMFGCVVGSQLSGVLADMWGRKTSLMVFLMMNIVSMFGLTFVTHYLMLLVMMFLVGTSGLGIICPAFVLKMEIVGQSKRRLPGIGISIFFALGEMVLAVLAYLLRDWQHLMLAASVLTLPYLAYWWIIPESPRWLINQGRLAEAERILRRIARVNKATLSPGLLEKLPVDSAARVPLWRVCVSAKRLLGRHLIVFLAWTLASMTYYGLSLNVGTLGGSVYVNVVLMGTVELLGFAVCLWLLERQGRRVLCSAMFLLAGLACTATLFPVLYAKPDQQWMTVALALTGKCGIAGAFAITWLYSSELFPTVIRNSAMGASSLCARLGGLIAPYIANLDGGGPGGKALPLVIFGVPSILVCLLLFCLPETRHCQMPESVQDAIDMGKKKKRDQTSEIIIP